jgi:hypothetical protein
MYDKFYKVVFPQPEIWKDVSGFEGAFQVSNYGNVKSLDKVTTWWCEKLGKNKSRTFYGKVLTKRIKDGYAEVHLRHKGKNKYPRIHRLVAETFIEGTANYPVIDHKDDNKLNNTVWNLEPCTVSYNTKKAADSGKLIVGDINRVHNKLTEETKQLVRDLLADGMSMRKIERDYKVSQRSIARIRDGVI